MRAVEKDRLEVARLGRQSSDADLEKRAAAQKNHKHSTDVRAFRSELKKQVIVNSNKRLVERQNFEAGCVEMSNKVREYKEF